MPYDLGPGALAWLAVACLVAGFVRGYSGFGFSALLIACLLYTSDAADE